MQHSASRIKLFPRLVLTLQTPSAVMCPLATCLFLGMLMFGQASAQVSDSTTRAVHVQGAVNFRDLGGYTAADGKHIKWNVLYRSADLSTLTDKDLALMDSLHIRYDVDLRGKAESAKAPDRMNPQTDYILCPAGSDSLQDWYKHMAGLTSGDSLMIAFYANTTYLTARYKPMFTKILALPQGDALLFHCTAGKDRTGIGAALILYALGVDYDTIVADYTATNVYRQKLNDRLIPVMTQQMHVNEQVARDMMSAKKIYLDATFAAIRAQYGSVDAYLRDQIGLDSAALVSLRARYLE
jgi:protein-tyrosine phosphatase